MKKCQHFFARPREGKLLVFLMLPLLLISLYPPLSLAYTETRITNDSVKQAYPDVSEEGIVWQDYRNDDGSWTNIDIFGRSLPYPGSEFAITTAQKNQLYPTIYQDLVVWGDFRNNSDFNIYLYNLTTSGETQITSDSSEQSSPHIYGDKMVYMDRRNGNRDIYLYDLSTSQESQITTDTSTQGAPRIFEDIIVWQDYRNGWPDIYMYDLSVDSDGNGTPNYLEVSRPDPDPAEVRVTTDPKQQINPDVYGDRIVWQDERNDDGSGTNWNIYMYDISTQIESSVTTASGNQFYPKIYGDWVIWQDKRIGTNYGDIYGKDLSGGGDQQIVANGYVQSFPEIYGNRVVWEDNRYGEVEIYYIPDLFTDSVAGPPTVSSTDPSNGQTGVAVNASVKATFSEDIDGYTITTSTFTLDQGGIPIAGATSYDSPSKTAFFVPNSSLSPFTTYNATLTTEVRDKAGNSMASNYSWSFDTGDVTIVSGDMLVKFTEGTNGVLILGSDPDVLDYAAISVGTDTIYEVDLDDPAVDIDAKVTEYNNRGDVVYAERNYPRTSGSKDSSDSSDEETGRSVNDSKGAKNSGPKKGRKIRKRKKASPKVVNPSNVSSKAISSVGSVERRINRKRAKIDKKENFSIRLALPFL